MSVLADRYPGAQPFGDTALDRLRFRGRDTESELLLHQLAGADLLVLFGKPGLGKTSLLNARLFPLLRERDFLPLPVRFNQSDSLSPLQVFIVAIEQTCKADKIDYTPGDVGGLWEFFKTAVFWRGDRLQTPVLVLDQFEEIFTLQAEEFRWSAAAELGELVSRRLPDRLRQRLESDDVLGFSEKAPEVKVLLSMREDDLGMLQELTPQMPSILQNRLRLTPLSDADARRAITDPAALVSERMEFATTPFAYEPGTVEDIVTAARSPHGGIDPFVLQLVCGHVERKVLRQQGRRNASAAIVVDSTYLGGEEGMRALTRSFYLDCIERLPQPRLQSRARYLCEEGLLTENGRRRSVLKDELLNRFKLGSDSLQLLEQARLLRSESRDGNLYYEISHDRIAEAIHYNRRWRMPRELQRLVGMLIVAVLSVAVIVSLYQARLARIEADRAHQANLLNSVLFDLFDQLNSPNRRPEVLHDVAEKMEEYLIGLPKELATTSRVRLEQVLGDVLMAQGKLQEAQGSYQKSLPIAKQLAERDKSNAERQRDLAVIYAKIGDCFRNQGDLADALNSYRNSLAITEKLTKQVPSNAAWQSDLSNSYEAIGDVLRGQGDLTGVLNSYRNSLAIREKLTKQNPSNAGWQSDLSSSYERLGDVLRDQGDEAGALKSYRDSLAIRQNLVTEDPGNAYRQRNLAFSYGRIGDVFRDQGDLPGALKRFRDSLSIRQKLVAEDPWNADWRRDLAVSYGKIGDVLRDQGDLPEALGSFRDSLSIRQKLATQDPGNYSWQGNLADSYVKIGEVLRDEGDLSSALNSCRKSLEIREKLAARDPTNVQRKTDLVLSLWKLASVLEQQGVSQKREAGVNYQRALEILRPLVVENRLTAEQKTWINQLEVRLKAITE
jgi:tetratricopeptide (TPR) repeat protein